VTAARGAVNGRRWAKRIGVALLAACLAAACEERARTFAFAYDARPAVTEPAARVDAARALFGAAARVAHARGCVTLVFDAAPPTVFCESGDGPALDGHTRFSIGSLWKQFVGFRVHELARAGRIRLDAPITTYLPELAGTPAGRTRVDQLLHMTSGLPYVIGLGTNLATQASRAQRSDADYLREAATAHLSFEPGTQYAYSNVGYGLLAVATGRVESKPWRDVYLDLFARFAMRDTGFMTDREPEPPVIAGYVPYRCGLVVGGACLARMPRWNYSMLPGGGVYSTIDDLVRWYEGMRRVEAEDPALFASFTTLGDVGTYASGWGLGARTLASGERLPMFDHDGEDPGYWSYFTRASAPGHGVTVIVLLSTDYSLDHAEFTLFRDLTSLAIGEPYRVMR
jgi:CubicO group peptidase (beta-lactamase class C family)